MLLVDDDRTQIFHRRKHRAARTDYNPRFPKSNSAPFVVSLARAQPRMQYRRVAAEARVEP